jgi:hypothetical protein
MRFMPGRTGLLVLAALFVCNLTVQAEDKVEVKIVDYNGLTKTIRDLKGKVVVVDFWADT